MLPPYSGCSELGTSTGTGYIAADSQPAHVFMVGTGTRFPAAAA